MNCGEALSQLFHHLIQHFAAGPNHRRRQRGQRLVRHVQHVNKSGGFRVDVEHSGQHLVLFFGFVEPSDGANPVGGIVVFLQLAQPQPGTVVHDDFDGRTWIIFDRDVFEYRDEVDLLQRLVMIFRVLVRLSRAFVIVEGDARRNYVQQNGAVVSDRGLQHGMKLPLVAGKGPPYESCSQRNRQFASVNGRQFIHRASLQRRSEIGGGGKLYLGQAVNAVVFDDVNDGQIAPHEVHELSDADGCRIAIAADAEGYQGTVRQHRAGRHRGHASVYRVEAVSARHEVGGSLRRASDAA